MTGNFKLFKSNECGTKIECLISWFEVELKSEHSDVLIVGSLKYIINLLHSMHSISFFLIDSSGHRLFPHKTEFEMIEI